VLLESRALQVLALLRRALLLTLAAVLLAGARGADAADVFPEATLHLEAVRYQPVEPELQWQGWIGGGATLLRANGVGLWGQAEVETILGHVIRPFEATQANYHLSFGLRRTVGRLEVAPFFRHVSRHYADRPKTQAVDWNLVGVEVSGRPWTAPVTVTASLGHTIQASLPGYEWEARARADAELWRRGGGAAVLRGALRLVSVRDHDTLPRGGFADWRLEGALRHDAHGRTLEAFVAAERRNDVFLETVGVRQRALFGLRVLLEREEAP
jgi:hypothetical protein